MGWDRTGQSRTRPGDTYRLAKVLESFAGVVIGARAMGVRHEELVAVLRAATAALDAQRSVYEADGDLVVKVLEDVVDEAVRQRDED